MNRILKCYKSWLSLVALIPLLEFAFTHEIISLATKDFKWTVEGDSLNISALPCDVPGSVHTALLKNGIIEDPYFGRRDEEYSWIADVNWVYTSSFNVSTTFSKTHSRLHFYGIDTISEIYLNEVVLGCSNNMFVEYSFLTDGILKEKNTLQIFFTSPTKYASEQYQTYRDTYGYVVPPRILPSVQHGRDHQNFIRKEQCSFSWDWGPSFPTVGIWKDVELEFTRIAFINNLIVLTDLNYDTGIWSLKFDVILESYSEKDVVFLFGFGDYTRKKAVRIEAGISRLALGKIHVHQKLISLWWPRGYGNQTLYEAWIRMFDPSSTEESCSKKVSFGFRTVELVEETIAGSHGLSFYFKINSRAIFLKGANWIPADSFQERVTLTTLDNLFQSAIRANINTLRVWGGGIYEKDEFYDLADKYGILIWQDLMFAVAMYPTNEAFLQSVQQEITSQVRRLQHHVSLIAWSGNNENEAAIAQNWWPEVKENREQLVKDYVKLYVETIQPVIAREDPTRPYVMSSPSNGPESVQSGYISKDPQNPLYGDVHFYDYLNDCWNVSMFPNPRFASEYGYQSYPSFITLSEVASKDDLKWNSSLMYYRQHHPEGNKEIEDFIKLHYLLPSTKDEQDYFKHMIYLSQIVQATCIKYETEHYRRLEGNLIDGTGYTMGALYWQLNDIWQSPSWSSIEYGGRWKMLHYYVQEFFSSLTVTGHILNDVLYVNYVTDYPDKQRSLVLNVTAYSWHKFGALTTSELRVDVGLKASVRMTFVFTDYLLKAINSIAYMAFHRKKVLSKDVDVKIQKLLFTKSLVDICPLHDCFIKIHLKDDKQLMIAQSDVFVNSFHTFLLPNPELKVLSITRRGKNHFDIQLFVNKPAAFVWLETTLSGRFSTNGFHMVDHEIKITFYSWKPCDSNALSSTLRVISLYDVYKD